MIDFAEMAQRNVKTNFKRAIVRVEPQEELEEEEELTPPHPPQPLPLLPPPPLLLLAMGRMLMDRVLMRMWRLTIWLVMTC